MNRPVRRAIVLAALLTIGVACGRAPAGLRVVALRAEWGDDGGGRRTLRVEGVAQGMRGERSGDGYSVDCVLDILVFDAQGRPVAAATLPEAVRFRGVDRPLARSDLYRDAPFLVEVPTGPDFQPGACRVVVKVRDALAGAEAEAEVSMRGVPP